MITFKALIPRIRAQKREDIFMVTMLAVMFGLLSLHGAKVFAHLWGGRIRAFWVGPFTPLQGAVAVLLLVFPIGASFRWWANRHGKLPGMVRGGRLLILASVGVPGYMGCWIMLTAFQSLYLGARTLVQGQPIHPNPLVPGDPFYFIFGFLGCAILGFCVASISHWLLPGYLTAHLDAKDRERLFTQLSKPVS